MRDLCSLREVGEKFKRSLREVGLQTSYYQIDKQISLREIYEKFKRTPMISSRKSERVSEGKPVERGNTHSSPGWARGPRPIADQIRDDGRRWFDPSTSSGLTNRVRRDDMAPGNGQHGCCGTAEKTLSISWEMLKVTINQIAERFLAKWVDKAFAELKKEDAIVSPVRCKWEPAL